MVARSSSAYKAAWEQVKGGGEGEVRGGGGERGDLVEPGCGGGRRGGAPVLRQTETSWAGTDRLWPQPTQRQAPTQGKGKVLPQAPSSPPPLQPGPT